MERVCKQLTYLNSYAIYQLVALVPFPMTLNETNLVFKVRPFFDTKYRPITNGYRYGHSYHIKGE